MGATLLYGVDPLSPRSRGASAFARGSGGQDGEAGPPVSRLQRGKQDGVTGELIANLPSSQLRRAVGLLITDPLRSFANHGPALRRNYFGVALKCRLSMILFYAS